MSTILHLRKALDDRLDHRAREFEGLGMDYDEDGILKATRKPYHIAICLLALCLIGLAIVP